MTKRILGALAVAATMSATAAYAQKVNVDSDPTAPFASYKTFAWTAGTPSPNPLGEQRIHDGVNAQLALKGMMETSAAPDVYVATHLTAREEQEIVSDGFGYGPWWGGGFTTTRVNTYVKGTLIVDLYDAKTKKMVWRGTATDTASDKPSKNAKKLTEALEKLFERFPA